MDDLLAGLNENQRTAATSPAAVLQVLAPPGSGKTKTLTARVAYLVAHQQLKPWNIIVCTFTVKAANEMKERIRASVGDETAKQLKLGTFHSVSLRYLKHYGHHIGIPKDFGIADSGDSKAIIKRIIKKQGLSIEPGPALGRISTRKVKGGSPQNGPSNVEQREFDRLFVEYENTLAASNLLDYDDLLLRCCFLLRSHPQCVSNVQAVLIDEFQDTNNTQYDLMSLFAQQHNAITIVGDPDQSIYGFRMAEIKNLTRMKTQWPDTLTINLEENYRSSGAILHAAQMIIEQDESRPPKKLQATHTFGLRPVLRKLPSAAAEADWLVTEIRRIRAMSGAMVDLSDVAILLRSAALSRVIESALGTAGIAYRMVGGLKFYDRIEVKLVVDYLRVIHQPGNSEAVERVINVPSRRIGEETIRKLREEAQGRDATLWELILDIAQGRYNAKTKLTEPTSKGLSAFVNVILTGQKKISTWKTEEPSLCDLINLVVQKISLQSYLRSKYTGDETFEARWTNVEELMAQAAELSSPERLSEMAESEGLPTLEDLKQRDDSTEDVLSLFLANIALTAAAEKKAAENNEKVQQVTISTIHAAKGLEWPVVFIPACYDGSIPHSRADDHDEERRLLYVGMTRAQAMLYLSCPIKNTQREETTMSTFLTQPGLGVYFEEYGPSLPASVVASLAVTLRRECAADALVSGLKAALERDEDNFWPVNAEEPVRESRPWRNSPALDFPGFSSARAAPADSVNGMLAQQQRQRNGVKITADSSFNSIMAQHEQNSVLAPAPTLAGFSSVAARYDELMELSALRKVDKRVDQQQSAPQAAPKGQKRQLEGQGTIASFFGKRSRPEKPEARTQGATRVPMAPIRDGANLGTAATTAAPMEATKPVQPALATHKPRMAPAFSRPGGGATDDEQTKRGDYVFLSSPPTKEADEERGDEATNDDETATAVPRKAPLMGMRPASTFHNTSMDRAAPQRRTLGMRRSVQGWNAGKKT